MTGYEFYYIVVVESGVELHFFDVEILLFIWLGVEVLHNLYRVDFPVKLVLNFINFAVSTLT